MLKIIKEKQSRFKNIKKTRNKPQGLHDPQDTQDSQDQ